MKICVWFSDCPLLGCNLDCPTGQAVDFSGCPVCKCIDPKPHYCQVFSTVLVHAKFLENKTTMATIFDNNDNQLKIINFIAHSTSPVMKVKYASGVTLESDVLHVLQDIRVNHVHHRMMPFVFLKTQVRKVIYTERELSFLVSVTENMKL